MQEDAEILLARRGGLGVITLNRPAALNALTLNMIRMMNDALAEWAADDAVRAVVVTGAGGKAFCAGGDVKTVALDIKSGGSDLGRDFFREEYILNHRIYNFPKPYIALIDGICMGGGKGISAHGSHRIVSENTVFAMPETNIGFFPDVGGGYFLPRCPGETGAYLALTSRRIGAADTLHIGFATHAVPSAKMPDLLAALASADDIDAVINDFAAAADKPSALAPLRLQIDACFAFDRVEDIVAALHADGSDFAKETLIALRGMSPTSLKVALRQIRLGAEMNFADVMTMEYRLSQSMIARPDFYEGIRAALIDKDRTPHWRPATLDEVSDADVESCFAAGSARDLVFTSD